MMMQEDESQYRNNLCVDDIDLSFLRLDDSSFSPEISPLKRSSPVSDESDQPKRRKLSPQNPIFIASPLPFTHPETQSPSSPIEDPTRFQNLTTGPVSKKQETKTPDDTEEPQKQKMTMKMVNNRVEEETYYGYEKHRGEVVEEDDCGEGMRIERSGEGFVIRLKCRCRLAFRVLFDDHHLYFKPL